MSEKASFIPVYKVAQPFLPTVDVVIHQLHPLQDWSTHSPRYWRWWQLTTLNSQLSLEISLSWGEPPSYMQYIWLIKVGVPKSLPQLGSILKGLLSFRVPHGVSWGTLPSCAFLLPQVLILRHSQISSCHASLCPRICSLGNQTAMPPFSLYSVLFIFK